MATRPSVGRRVGLVLIVLVVVAAAGSAAYWWWNHKPVDRVAILEANTRGVAYTDRFDFPHAIGEFEKVVQLDPDWLPGRINLGLALLNNVVNDPGSLDRAAPIF